MTEKFQVEAEVATNKEIRAELAVSLERSLAYIKTQANNFDDEDPMSNALSLQVNMIDQILKEISLPKASEYKTRLKRMLINWDQDKLIKFFEEKFDILVFESGEVPVNFYKSMRHTIRAATTDLQTKDGKTIYLQGENISSREFLNDGPKIDIENLYYSRPNEMTFLHDKLDVCEVYVCIDIDCFFKTVSHHEDFLNELAVVMAEDDTSEFINDLK